jgi:carbon storage regulator
VKPKIEKEFEMLVLTRSSGETITIGNDIKLTVTRIKGRTVRIAVEAPAGMKILRGELIPGKHLTGSHEPLAKTLQKGKEIA